MSKRAGQFERRASDFYPTPPEAVLPLARHLKHGTKFIEPCAGDLTLAREVVRYGHDLVHARDIFPRHPSVIQADALDIRNCNGVDAFITNPPWPHKGKFGDPAVSIAKHLSNMRPTWLLLPADFMHTHYAAELMHRCADIVPVGRVRWIEGTKYDGKDNACWYQFIAHNCECVFHPRVARHHLALAD